MKPQEQRGIHLYKDDFAFEKSQNLEQSAHVITDTATKSKRGIGGFFDKPLLLLAMRFQILTLFLQSSPSATNIIFLQPEKMDQGAFIMALFNKTIIKSGRGKKLLGWG